MTGSSTGLCCPAPATSSWRTAKPSMAELSSGGRSSGEVTSSASVSPNASGSDTSTGAIGET